MFAPLVWIIIPIATVYWLSRAVIATANYVRLESRFTAIDSFSLEVLETATHRLSKEEEEFLAKLRTERSKKKDAAGQCLLFWVAFLIFGSLTALLYSVFSDL